MQLLIYAYTKTDFQSGEIRVHGHTFVLVQFSVILHIRIFVLRWFSYPNKNTNNRIDHFLLPFLYSFFFLIYRLRNFLFWVFWLLRFLRKLFNGRTIKFFVSFIVLVFFCNRQILDRSRTFLCAQIFWWVINYYPPIDHSGLFRLNRVLKNIFWRLNHVFTVK